MTQVSQIQSMQTRINQIMLDGMKHGFFEMSIEGMTNKGKVRVTVHAGKKYQFTIPLEELHANQLSTSEMEATHNTQ